MMNILVIAEHNNKAINQSTFSTIAAGLQIVSKLGTNCNFDVLVAGYDSNNNLTAVANKIKELKLVNKILVANHSSYEYGLAEDISDLVHELAKDYDYILFPATTYGKNIAPRVAALLDVNPLTDVIAVEAEDVFMRPIYAGNAIAKYKLNDKIKVLSIRPTNFNLDSMMSKKSTTQESEVISLNTSSTVSKNLAKFVRYELSNSDRPDLATADIVVSGGRGLQSKENFKLINDLAEVLNAAVGASRAAVDAGYVPNDYQVGQTGKVVAPSLYIAVGISGAIQHLAGMQDSKVIVAINKDEEAAIFKVADYGLVGDLFKILPELTEKLKQAKL